MLGGYHARPLPTITDMRHIHFHVSVFTPEVDNKLDQSNIHLSQIFIRPDPVYN